MLEKIYGFLPDCTSPPLVIINVDTFELQCPVAGAIKTPLHPPINTSDGDIHENDNGLTYSTAYKIQTRCIRYQTYPPPVC